MKERTAALKIDPDRRQTSSGGDFPTRTETDGLGTREIPADAYWGINVSRALENFPVSGRKISEHAELIYAFAAVKQACARANAEIGALDAGKARLIDRACEEIKQGALRDQFVVDMMQGGAGTSTNMNVNEVIANRALELGGYEKGSYRHLDPNDDVNRCQSTNDTYPTALKLGLWLASDRLLEELGLLVAAFRTKGVEFAGVVKVGRTQLQDAVPMTLGQEFEAFAATLEKELKNIASVRTELRESNLGGTAIGTGIAAKVGFTEAACRHLSEILGFEVSAAENLIEATSDMGAFVSFSGSLKRLAVKLSKISNDLRLLSSGPQAGINDINLPPRQAGSSIMPGKVNPVIPEVVNEVAFSVIGGDATVTMAAEAGQLQLNAFEPLIAQVLFQGIDWLGAAMKTLRVNCVEGISANERLLEERVGCFAGLSTALIPRIGYAASARIAKEALRTNTRIVDLVVKEGLLGREEAEKLLEPRALTSLA